MKTIVTLNFIITHIPGETQALLEHTGCGPDMLSPAGGWDLYDLEDRGKFLGHEDFVDLTIEDGDERLAKVFAFLESLDQQPGVSTEYVFSEEDLQTALLLEMSAGATWLQSDTRELGTKYDLKDACPHCGTGAKQSWYARIKRKDLPLLRKHRAIRTRNGLLLVDATMRSMLADAKTTGISFADVQARDDVGDWTSLEYQQVLIESTLPPMRGELAPKLAEDICNVCHRAGHYSFAPNRYYRAEDLLERKDFNFTWEWFGSFEFDGNARTSKFAFPKVLVTPNVMNLFREAGVAENFKWKPLVVGKSSPLWERYYPAGCAKDDNVCPVLLDIFRTDSSVLKDWYRKPKKPIPRTNKFTEMAIIR